MFIDFHSNYAYCGCPREFPWTPVRLLSWHGTWPRASGPWRVPPLSQTSTWGAVGPSSLRICCGICGSRIMGIQSSSRPFVRPSWGLLILTFRKGLRSPLPLRRPLGQETRESCWWCGFHLDKRRPARAGSHNRSDWCAPCYPINAIICMAAEWSPAFFSNIKTTCQRLSAKNVTHCSTCVNIFGN